MIIRIIHDKDELLRHAKGTMRDEDFTTARYARNYVAGLIKMPIEIL